MRRWDPAGPYAWELDEDDLTEHERMLSMVDPTTQGRPVEPAPGYEPTEPPDAHRVGVSAGRDPKRGESLERGSKS